MTTEDSAKVENAIEQKKWYTKPLMHFVTGVSAAVLLAGASYALYWASLPGMADTAGIGVAYALVLGLGATLIHVLYRTLPGFVSERGDA